MLWICGGFSDRRSPIVCRKMDWVTVIQMDEKLKYRPLGFTIYGIGGIIIMWNKMTSISNNNDSSNKEEEDEQ